MTEDDDGVVVGIQTSTGERNGKQLEVGNCIVFELKDGRITDGREHFEDLYAWDVFGDSPTGRRWRRLEMGRFLPEDWVRRRGDPVVESAGANSWHVLALAGPFSVVRSRVLEVPVARKRQLRRSDGELRCCGARSCRS